MDYRKTARSQGHLVFHDGYEYFVDLNGDVWKALIESAISLEVPYRVGARWHCTYAAWGLQCKVWRVTDGKTQNDQP